MKRIPGKRPHKVTLRGELKEYDKAVNEEVEECVYLDALYEDFWEEECNREEAEEVRRIEEEMSWFDYDD